MLNEFKFYLKTETKLSEKTINRHIKTTMNYFDKNVDFAKKAAYAHPYYKTKLTADQLIEDWISYINKTKTSQFDTKKLHEVFSKLYECKKPLPKER